MKKFLALLLAGFIWVSMTVGPAFGEETYTIPTLNEKGDVATFNKEEYNHADSSVRHNGRLIFVTFKLTEKKRVVALKFDGETRAWIIWEDFDRYQEELKGNYVLFDKDCNGTFEMKFSTTSDFKYPDCFKK